MVWSNNIVSIPPAQRNGAKPPYESDNVSKGKVPGSIEKSNPRAEVAPIRIFLPMFIIQDYDSNQGSEGFTNFQVN